MLQYSITLCYSSLHYIVRGHLQRGSRAAVPRHGRPELRRLAEERPDPTYDLCYYYLLILLLVVLLLSSLLLVLLLRVNLLYVTVTIMIIIIIIIIHIMILLLLLLLLFRSGPAFVAYPGKFGEGIYLTPSFQMARACIMLYYHVIQSYSIL